MKKPFEGGCACGAIRYQCDGDPIMMFQCHCRDCQRASGGPFVAAILVPIKSFKFLKGSPKYYSTPSTSGGQHVRGFCENCGSRLTGGQKDRPLPYIGITVSSLDDPTWFKSQMHFFVSQAQPWDEMHDDLPKYDLYPPQK
jgi:hypothetical protein